ncbi:PAS domain-containing sensor histidine kinase [Phenylobacterium sp.]|uniref:hybrid sensor histidine kinase/response regulator n=1 Tax=Phenylobacterium sp. TaxID=1871053 RepID=UPI0027346ADA|nr:PAS domain-containing sensor histidine kinase [Phenylobacterium sp.]MDP3852830.1 PAS domain S-box protein [Phenylobacterium sp.]
MDDSSGGKAALIDDDGRYRLLVESITDYAVYMLDPSGVVISWNPGAQRFKGYTAAEIVGHNFSRFYTESDRAAGIPQHGLATAAAEGRFETEGWRVRKDGGRFWAHVVIDPIRSHTGEILGFAKITRDLTERRASEEALRRSEEQFRLLAQGVTDYAIYMLDPQGRVTNWNLGAERIKGYSADEIVGQHFSRFYTDEDRAAGLPERGLAVAAREGRSETEGWRIRKDGGRFWANVVIDAIRGPDGAIIGFAKVTRDVTERRAVAQALEEAREALFQSQKLDAIGQLTGGVAHDFNNLLMAILGSLELVMKRIPVHPRTTPLIENAIHAAQRGATLTRRMLAFARRQELRREAVDVHNLVGGLVGLVERSIGPTVKVEVRLATGLPPVETEANQLESALLNLAVNARDAMPDGGVLTIWAEMADHPGGDNLPEGPYVRIGVTDTGEGMDEETLGRAVDPFFTTKGVGKGTGLGLSMVHGLAEQSRGRLKLASRKGDGSTIELWLPVATGPVIQAPIAADLPVDPDAAPLVILAVDDDELVLLNTGAMLEDLGHAVFAARSGQEALAVLRRGKRVDLVISDHAMPNMTGVQLAEAIRAEWPDVPLILASGYAELPAGSEPAVIQLAKPFGQAELAHAIAQLARS